MPRKQSEAPAIDGDAVAAILTNLPPEEHDRPFRLLEEGPAVEERLTGRRPHLSKLYRHWRDGVYGRRLYAVSNGGTLLCTARWMAEHWVAVAAARLTAAKAKAK